MMLAGAGGEFMAVSLLTVVATVVGSSTGAAVLEPPPPPVVGDCNYRAGKCFNPMIEECAGNTVLTDLECGVDRPLCCQNSSTVATHKVDNCTLPHVSAVGGCFDMSAGTEMCPTALIDSPYSTCPSAHPLCCIDQFSRNTYLGVVVHPRPWIRREHILCLRNPSFGDGGADAVVVILTDLDGIPLPHAATTLAAVRAAGVMPIEVIVHPGSAKSPPLAKRSPSPGTTPGGSHRHATVADDPQPTPPPPVDPRLVDHWAGARPPASKVPYVNDAVDRVMSAVAFAVDTVPEVARVWLAVEGEWGDTAEQSKQAAEEAMRAVVEFNTRAVGVMSNYEHWGLVFGSASHTIPPIVAPQVQSLDSSKIVDRAIPVPLMWIEPDGLVTNIRFGVDEPVFTGDTITPPPPPPPPPPHHHRPTPTAVPVDPVTMPADKPADKSDNKPADDPPGKPSNTLADGVAVDPTAVPTDVPAETLVKPDGDGADGSGSVDVMKTAQDGSGMPSDTGVTTQPVGSSGGSDPSKVASGAVDPTKAVAQADPSVTADDGSRKGPRSRRGAVTEKTPTPGGAEEGSRGTGKTVRAYAFGGYETALAKVYRLGKDSNAVGAIGVGGYHGDLAVHGDPKSYCGAGAAAFLSSSERWGSALLTPPPPEGINHHLRMIVAAGLVGLLAVVLAVMAYVPHSWYPNVMCWEREVVEPGSRRAVGVSEDPLLEHELVLGMREGHSHSGL